MAIIEPIKIKGLRDFQSALKHMDGETQKMLRVVLNAVAEPIATAARSRIPSVTGKARASIRVASGQREAKIKAGGAKAKYYPWLDFGGRVGRKRSIKRPFLNDGRYLYPTFRSRRAETLKTLEDALGDLAVNAGLEVTRNG